jgi:AmiR/NasT family two-component response regulator
VDVRNAQEAGSMRVQQSGSSVLSLDNKRLISAAIGITMVHFRLGHKDAFGLLRKAALSQHRKLHEVAADVVAAAETLSLIL